MDKCIKVIKFFKKSHQAGEYLKEEIVNELITGGNLKSYIKTRWTTAYDSTKSLLRLENCFRKVSLLSLLFNFIYNYKFIF